MSLLKSLFGKKAPREVAIEPFGARFEISGSETVLEAALRNGVPFPHNCTVGTCGSCKCMLKEGRVRALSDFGYTLSQVEIEAGFILACQAVPKDELTRIAVEDAGVDLPQPEAYTATLVKRTVLTHDICAMTLKLDRPMRFVAGQYVNVMREGLGRFRSYSYANAPEREGLTEVEFFVRKIPGGAFSAPLYDGELDGTTLTVDGPHGSFYLRPSAAPMICIAGGSGLAPVLSVLEHARRTRVKRPCVLLFGARTQADLYGLDQIKAIANDWLDRFVFTPVLSHEPDTSDWSGARGWVTDQLAQPDLVPDWGEAQGYMCGPPPMIDAGIAAMTQRGMPLAAIHYDKFTDMSHAAPGP